MNFKPMLSGKAPDNLSTLKYPVAVSPKLDGFRALVIDGILYSRNLKPIRNTHVQKLFGRVEYNGYDGELIVGDPTSKTCFRDTSSGVTSFEGEPDVRFYVFDNMMFPGVWHERYASIKSSGHVFKADHYIVNHPDEIITYEEQFLNEGYEGLMIRAIEGPYKQGRSTAREGYLLKLKRFEDSEALVIGVEEKMHNANEATVDALGHTSRTSHQENLVPLNTMGALIVRDLKTGVEFNIGTGFDDESRREWWNERNRLLNYYTVLSDGGKRIMFDLPELIVKYKHFAQGGKDRPRFPTYLGLRDKDDL